MKKRFENECSEFLNSSIFTQKSLLVAEQFLNTNTTSHYFLNITKNHPKISKNAKDLEIIFFRTESPRRRSSTTNLNNLGRRSSSLTPNQAGSTVSINNSPQSKIITSPKSRSSSSQQLIAGSNPKARALYAKQGSASLLLQNAQANSTNNLIHSVTHGNQNKTKSSVSDRNYSPILQIVYLLFCLTVGQIFIVATLRFWQHQ